MKDLKGLNHSKDLKEKETMLLLKKSIKLL